jgi:hypothetical protein
MVTGLLVAVPLGYLLSYGASLLTFLGLFFFMLFGLAIGAAMFRVGRPARPIGRWKLRAGTAVVALFGWGLGLTLEGYEFPSDVAHRVLKPESRIYRRRPEGVTPSQIRQSVIESTRAYLKQQYPPGGPLGYMQWKATSDRLPLQVPGREEPVTLQYKRKNGAWWLVRVILSIGLFAFAIHSQVQLLGRPEPADDSGPADPSSEMQESENDGGEGNGGRCPEGQVQG